jgi:hypothetical protein
VEQIRFTLGIFQRHIRNKSFAWRSLGYILDHKSFSSDPQAKTNDYQFMVDTILQSYKNAQSKSIAWNLNFNNEKVRVAFRIPTLFIIGDTDGHDKLVGKFGTRTSTVKRLCRYCNCATDDTDNPFVSFELNRAKQISRLIVANDVTKLKEMSFHCVKNAWDDIIFCDAIHGIYGATPAEAMHCLQLGLYEYIIKQLFEQKKIKGNQSNQPTTKKQKRNKNEEAKVSDDNLADEDDFIETNWNDNIVLSRLGVFSDTYCKRFDFLARKYGCYLMHQSDRNLPRTHFNTNYTSTGYKNANEVTGILIVYLIIFGSSEGETLDKGLGDKRSAQYLHLFELMLLLEYFCKSDELKRSSINLMKKTMPNILETLKNTLDRQVGNGMKIIKFHLPLHFADDIQRFGTMANYDSGICESHHKDFAKQPIRNVVRMYLRFKLQNVLLRIWR